MVPTVYREDYLLALKALSHNEVAEPLLRREADISTEPEADISI